MINVKFYISVIIFRIRYLPIQKRIETNVSGQLSKHTSPHAVTVRYQVKNGNQQSKNAPITIPSVTKALCSFLQDVWILCRSRNPTQMSEKYMISIKEICLQEVAIEFIAIHFFMRFLS